MVENRTALFRVVLALIPKDAKADKEQTWVYHATNTHDAKKEHPMGSTEWKYDGERR